MRIRRAQKQNLEQLKQDFKETVDRYWKQQIYPKLIAGEHTAINMADTEGYHPEGPELDFASAVWDIFWNELDNDLPVKGESLEEIDRSLAESVVSEYYREHKAEIDKAFEMARRTSSSQAFHKKGQTLPEGQDVGRPEAWEWIEQIPEEMEEAEAETGWNPEERERGARRFFQLWTTPKGRGYAAYIKPNVPIRCSVWRYRKLRFEGIMDEIIFKDPQGLVASYMRGFDEVYEEAMRLAEEDEDLAERMEQVNVLLGRRGMGPGLAARIEKEREEAEEQVTLRDISAAEDAVRYFYSGLENFPALQKKFLSEVVNDRYTRFDDPKKRTGGFHTGTARAGGTMRSNRLLTFFLMKDPYPYLQSFPVKEDGSRYTADELRAEFPEGNTPETALDGEPRKGGKKLFSELGYVEPLNIYFRNARNPDYDFMTITTAEARKQAQARSMLRDKVNDLQRLALFQGIYLAKNVLEDSEGFEDREETPGISLHHLGAEGGLYDIADHERDVTTLEDGGLFWVPGGELPKPVKKKTEEKEEKKTFKGFKKKESWQSPPKDLFAQAIFDKFAQEFESLDEMWIDDEGHEHPSMESIIDKYDREAVTGLPEGQIKKEIEDRVLRELGASAPKPGMGMPISQPYEVTTTAPEVQETQTPEQYEAEEEEIPLAAKQIVRLVRVANQLDKKGLHAEAIFVDRLAGEIVNKLIQNVDQRTLGG